MYNTKNLKNTQIEAIKVRKKVINSLERASINKDKKILSFVIVVGGPTGVELAGELTEFLDHNIRRFQSIKREDIKIYLKKRRKYLRIIKLTHALEKEK